VVREGQCCAWLLTSGPCPCPYSYGIVIALYFIVIVLHHQGQVPPWAQPQITNFAVQETIIKTVEAAVAAYGVTSISGSDGNVEVNEDVTEMCKGYKEGDSLQFTATLNCAMKEVAVPVPEVKEATSDVVDMADVVDVEVSEVTPVVEE
jgi:hypothetical protein